ncbi:MAG: protein kinase, partial [Planctomycetota bacterium]
MNENCDLERQLEEALSDQRDASRLSELSSPEALFERFPALCDDTESVVDIVYNDFLLRTELSAESGIEPPDGAEYLRRFPDVADALAKQLSLHDGLLKFEASTLRSPTQIVGERFRVEEKLADGGFAEVYRGWDCQLKRRVAIKICRAPAFDEQARLFQRFRREAESAARLSHPAIVAIYEFGTDAGRPFIVSRLLEGGTLSTRLADARTDRQTLVQWCIQICEAVHYAHLFGVVHRDIKPSNILFDEFEQPYLADFGLANLLDGQAKLTEHGDILGTPAYMSPEQATGEVNIGPASDVYTLGVVLYEMLTGRLPFVGKAHGILQQTISTPPPDP